MEKRTRSVLGLVFLTVFLDIVGFSIIFPLFPQMLEHYLGLEGPDSMVGRLVQRLAEFSGTGPKAEFAVVTLFGSVLGSIYSLLQFLFAPFWGGMSDRIGRRPTLLLTLTGITFSYAIWFFAGTFALLIAARILGGIMAGNISTASAVVADVCPEEERAKGMGILGMGIGLGFVLGPALGGMAYYLDLTESLGTAYGINPFSFAAGLAFLMSALNLFLVARRLPETLPPERRGATSEGRSLNPFAQLKRLAFPGVPRTNIVYFLFLLAFSAIEFTLTFLATERFVTAAGEPFSPRENMWMFVFVGLLIALVQGGFVRRMAPRYGEKRLAIAGILIVAPGFLLIGTCTTLIQLYAGLAFMAIGSAFVMPCMSALVSRYTPGDRQGLSLGTFRSMGALSRAMGPVLGGLLYWRFGSSTPYIWGALFLALPVLLAIGLPAPKPAAKTAQAAS